jgi:hypothetical protein
MLRPKRIADLTAEDFPGMNAEKFYEWRAARLRVRRNRLIFLVIFGLCAIALAPFLGLMVFPVGVPPFLLLRLLNAKPVRVARSLERELWLDPRPARSGGASPSADRSDR